MRFNMLTKCMLIFEQCVQHLSIAKIRNMFCLPLHFLPLHYLLFPAYPSSSHLAAPHNRNSCKISTFVARIWSWSLMLKLMLMLSCSWLWHALFQSRATQHKTFQTVKRLSKYPPFPPWAGKESLPPRCPLKHSSGEHNWLACQAKDSAAIWQQLLLPLERGREGGKENDGTSRYLQ